jgi:hypothetical protein
VALGWGLWEGPARFYFQGLLNLARPIISIQQLISVVDFQFKGHNIPHDNQPPGPLYLRTMEHRATSR